VLDRQTLVTDGNATPQDLTSVELLRTSASEESLCGLGKTSPNPVLTGLKYFREEYEEHTRGICRANKCQPLIKYSITDNCTGCTKCSQDCPVNAITFRTYEKHEIDQSICTKCDNCRIVCPEKAIEIINING
jgi:NADH-quinone oxidoreductase subunit F